MTNNNKNREKDNTGHAKYTSDSIGNAQGTTQTGAQNGGGENIEEEGDGYTEDLRQSGQRQSRNEDADADKG